MNKNIRILILIVVDIVCVLLAYMIAFLARFNFDVNNDGFIHWSSVFSKWVALIVIIKIAILFIFKIYNTLWRYAGIEELLRIFGACFVSNAFSIATLEIVSSGIPRSIYLSAFLIDILLITLSRFVYRYLKNSKEGLNVKSFFNNFKASTFSLPDQTRVLLVGAGDAGNSILKEIRMNKNTDLKIVAIVDDNPTKKGKLLAGIKIHGGTSEIRHVVRKYNIDEIIIAIPSASKTQMSNIVIEANKTSAKVRIVPAIMDLVNNNVNMQSLRELRIEDLLGRDEVQLNVKEISSYLEGKVVLVTGAGGSIGSMLVKMIVRYRPRMLILVDNYENNVFELVSDIDGQIEKDKIKTVIASIQDKSRIQHVFQKLRPNVVFHAAAHKHVPLMETNIKEALANNVLGSKNVIDLADEFGVEKFILISTDKAVNPKNIMGVTKRLTEMILRQKAESSKTKFTAVRFGNVLGSNGSVIPIFSKQIKKGGPITITDPEIERYFMTIEEAAGLVIQAGALSKGGEIFILDMGDPIKILTLAENMIKLSGLEPYDDIKIETIGLRPGEKLYEELTYEDEKISFSAHEGIFIAEQGPLPENLTKALEGNGETFEKVIRDYVLTIKDDEIKKWLQKIIPEYEFSIDDKKNAEKPIDKTRLTMTDFDKEE